MTVEKEYIAFYISSHGFGHLTRSLALIENILEHKHYSIYIASGKPQVDFAKQYLDIYKGRVRFSECNTDVGLINFPGTLEVDKKKLSKELEIFVSSWDEVVYLETKNLKKLNVKKVLSDISPIGFLVAEKINVESIGLSNFTWSDQYRFLNLDERILEAFSDAYQKSTLFIKYPLGLNLEGINCPKKELGFFCRSIDLDRVASLKKEYGPSLFLSVGKSASLKKIQVKNFNGNIFYTEGLLLSSESAKLTPIPLHTKDTQNYIAASDLAVLKAGWGSVAESLIGRTKLVLIERDDVLEDKNTIDELKKNGLAVSILEKELLNLDVELLLKRKDIVKSKPKKTENSIEKAIRMLDI